MATCFVSTRVSRSVRPKSIMKKQHSHFLKPVVLDTALARFMKRKNASRPHIIKAIWVYAKKAKLQRGGSIMNSGELKPLFGNKQLIKFGEIATMIKNHTVV